MGTGQLRVEREGPVGRLVLDNQERRNAISAGMWKAIPGAVADFDADPQIRVIVVRGAGTQAFAAGADISEFEQNRSSESQVADYEAATAAAHRALESSPKPVIALIHGFCVGGGLAVALSCDLRYADASSRFAIPAARLGLGYGVHGTRRLVATVGHANAREIMFSARRYDATEALAMGLVNRVMPDADLDAQVQKIAADLAANAPLTMAASKAVINAIAAGQSDYADAEAAVLRCMKSEDYVEGRRAFMEKRAPVFKGK
ncbi:MAG TPA: enoyl-CoA hydratase [Burkholderiales bacterium]|nr:enoyl-CoA hydratase [Burkholderiales bacterium]